ncbi:MAG TPA: response regulator [Paenibacillus sp.]|nr:response regulator [Paenibacillus sp.]
MYKVVLVDDEAIVKQSMRKLIEDADCGFRVVGEAKNGQQALDVIRETQPDVVVTDIHMPVMDGLELLERAAAEFPGLYAVILSGYDEFAYAQKALRLGAQDYLLKPITPENVEALLIKILKTLEADRRQMLEEMEWNWYCKVQARELAEKIWMLDEAAVERLTEEALAHAAVPGDARASDKRALLLVDALLRECRTRIPEDDEEAKLATARMAGEPLGSSSAREAFAAAAQEAMAYIRHRRNWGRRRQIEQVAAYIERSFADADLSLTDVAERVGLSPSRVSTLFKEEMGESFIQYVTRIRMEKAKQLLADPSIKTYEISEQVGYPNYSHFNKAFRRQIGVSPTEFKKRMGYY